MHFAVLSPICGASVIAIGGTAALPSTSIGVGDTMSEGLEEDMLIAVALSAVTPETRIGVANFVDTGFFNVDLRTPGAGMAGGNTAWRFGSKTTP